MKWHNTSFNYGSFGVEGLGGSILGCRVFSSQTLVCEVAYENLYHGILELFVFWSKVWFRASLGA